MPIRIPAPPPSYPLRHPSEADAGVLVEHWSTWARLGYSIRPSRVTGLYSYPLPCIFSSSTIGEGETSLATQRPSSIVARPSLHTPQCQLRVREVIHISQLDLTALVGHEQTQTGSSTTVLEVNQPSSNVSLLWSSSKTSRLCPIPSPSPAEHVLDHTMSSHPTRRYSSYSSIAPAPAPPPSLPPTVHPHATSNPSLAYPPDVLNYGMRTGAPYQS